MKAFGTNQGTLRGGFRRILAATMALWLMLPQARAHNLDTRATSIHFDDAFLQIMATRAGASQPLVQVGDKFWIIIKTVPGPGTETGVGGYQTFYVPPGVKVHSAAYVRAVPTSIDPRGFVEIAMKGQSPIAIGDGPIGAKTDPNLIGLTLPGVNGLGINNAPVDAAGKHRGTIAGVYADTGIFYSDDPRTAFYTYQTPSSGPETGGTEPLLTNNSGDTVGEYDAANVVNPNVLGVTTLWDAYQEIGYGSKGLPEISVVDPIDQRGNAPWGLASAVAGPQSGYAWEFDYNAYKTTSGTKLQKVQAAVKIGPWKRIQYPGSQISKDQPGLISTTLGYAGVDASTLGYDLNDVNNTLERQANGTGVNAIRFSIGQLQLNRQESSAVQVEIVQPISATCYRMYGDAFGGDAGGTDNGKDHIWRYFDPTVVFLEPCVQLQKHSSKPVVAPGETFSYTLTFANNGTIPLPNITINDTLPTGITYVSAVPSPAIVSGQSLTWNLGTVPANSLVTITLNVKATGAGTLCNTITAKSNGTTTAIADECTEVVVKPLLIKKKTVLQSNVAPGATVDYTITVDNNGTGTAGVPLVATDTLPAGFTFSSLTSATLNGSPYVPVVAGTASQPTFTVGLGLQAGKQLVINFKAVVGANVAPGTYCNQVEVAHDGIREGPVPEACLTVGGGQIGDTVFRDWNGNGTQDAVDEGMPGVTVTLTKPDLSTVTAVTDVDGKYLFTGLPAGNYTVTVPAPGFGGVPAGYTLTADPDGGTLLPMYTKTLALNEQFLGADWGYQPGGTGTIGDLVFEDLNKSGVWESGEPGIKDVTVSLYEDTNGNGIKDAGDALVATQVSGDGIRDVDGDGTANDPLGFYRFRHLDTARRYLVDVDQADADLGSYFTTVYGASANLGTSTDPTPILSGFTAVTTADFGFWRNSPATVGDQVFVDVNNNGTYDAGDLPLPNVTVRLYANDGTTLLNSTVSALDGTYSFTGLPPATYVVKVDTTDTDIPVYLAASISAYTGVVLIAGQTDNTRDFPFVNPGLLGKIVDKSFLNPAGTLTFTLTPSYAGPNLLVNATVTDVVPTGTTFNSAGQGGLNSPPVTWNLGSTTPAADGSKNIAISSLATITQRGTTSTAADTTTTTFTITTPTGVVAGDVMIANVNLRGGTSIGYPSLSGWTPVAETNIEQPAGGKQHRNSLLYRVATGNEGATAITFTLNSGVGGVDDVTGAIVAFSNVSNAGVKSDGTSGGPFDVDPPNAWSVGSGTSITGVTGLINPTANALVMMFVGTFDSATSVSAWATTDPGALNLGSYSYDGNGTSKGTIGAGWKAKLSTTTTGSGTATLGVSKKYGAILVALKPATTSSVNYDVTTALGADRRLVTSGTTVVVTLTATATGNAGTFTPPALVPTLVNGATVSGFSAPAATTLNNETKTFTYTGIVTAGSIPGSVRFAATPTDSNGTWSTGNSPSILVTPPLTLTVNVPSNPGVNFVNNTAQFNNNGSLFYQSPPTSTALTGSIGDFVWDDVNGDKIQDSGEPGIPGVRVYVDSNSNGQFDSGEPNAITDSTGHYRIYGFSAGTYLVRYDTTTIPAGFIPTTLDNKTVILASGEQYNLADFGLRPPSPTPSTIGDTLWLDTNQNGIVDNGESGIPYVDVQLYRDVNNNNVVDGGDQLLLTTSTDVNGNYQFSGLYIDNYVVKVVTTDPQFPAGVALVTGGSPVTSPPANGVQAVDITSNGSSITTADFGYNYTGQIGDFVWYDTNGNGVQDETECSGAPCGAPNATVVLVSDTDGNGVADFGEPAIAIYTTCDGSLAYPCSGGAQPGKYLFTGLPPGKYVVQMSEQEVPLPGNGATGKMVPTTGGDKAVTLTAGNMSVLTADFGLVAGAVVSGHVFHDVNHSASLDGGDILLPNVTVNLFSAGTDGIIGTGDDVLSQTKSTDAVGSYFFIVPAGDYRVEYVTTDPDIPTPINTVNGAATTPLAYTLTALAGGEYAGYDFGRDNKGTIGDTIYADLDGGGSQGAGEPGIPGVTVELYSDLNNNDQIDTPLINPDALLDTQVTDASGKYLFVGLADGNYIVKVVTSTLPSGYTLAPTGRPPTESTAGSSIAGATVALSGATLDRDFGYQPIATTYSVSGNVWHDNGAAPGIAGNGIKDGTEPNLPNVSVDISVDTDGAGPILPVVYTVVTDASGNYQLNGVPGTALIVITVNTATLPNPAFVQTGDPDVTKDNQTTFTMANANVTGKNFGYRAVLASIAGTVVRNADGDGLAEPGEIPVSGIAVTLRYAGLDGILNTEDDTTTPAVTDGSGDYSFTGLIPGFYEITKVNPTGYYSLADRDGGNPDSITLTIGPGNGATGVGDNKVDQDFELNAGTISGFVLADLNNDDVGDVGIPGVTLTLLNGDGTPYDGDPNTPGTQSLTTTTDGTGAYSFTGIPPGSYRVSETQPVGYASVSDVDGGNLDVIGDVSPVVLAAGATSSGNNFVEEQPASIGDYVWLDENSNGVQDAGEAGIGNVRVELFAANGSTLLATTFTDANGGYLFVNLSPGSYVVKVATSGTGALATGLAANPTYDFDGIVSAHTAAVTVSAGQEFVAADFGYNWSTTPDVSNNTGTGAIGDRLWVDTNSNGVQDPGEPGLGGIPVTLYWDSDGDGVIDAVKATTTSSVDGGYIFDGLPAGIYTVVVNGGTDPAGYTQTGDPDATLDNKTTTPVVLAPGDVYVNADFGYHPTGNFASIGDRVYFDANANGLQDGSDYGIAGVTVALIRDVNGNKVFDAGDGIIATTTTDASGAYLFTGLSTTDGVGTDDYLVWVNDTAHVLGGLTPTVDADTINPTTGFVTGYGISAVANLAGTDLTQDFGYTAAGQSQTTGLIGDTIYLDQNGDGQQGPGETGIEGVTVQLFDSTGSVQLAGTVTDENGHYYFPGLAAGTYVVKVVTTSLPGGGVGLVNTDDPGVGGAPDTGDNQSTVVLAAGGINLLQDFGYHAGTPNAISGTVWNDQNADGILSGEAGVYAGVTVALKDGNGNILATTVTDGSGNYTFGGLPNGTYTVDVTDTANILNGLWHSSGSQNVATDNTSKNDPYTLSVLNGQTVTTVDFGYYGAPSALSDFVWHDNGDGGGTANNGVQEGTEPGIPGVQVRLTITWPDTTQTLILTTTDSNGLYRFGNLSLDENLTGATYLISVPTLPGTASPTGNGTAATDSDNPSGTPAVVLKGATNPTYDFGFFGLPPTAIRLAYLKGWSLNGQVTVEWETVTELNTAGFDLYRKSAAGQWERVNRDLLPALNLSAGGVYRLYDEDLPIPSTQSYQLVELETTGKVNTYGPFEVLVQAAATADGVQLVNGAVQVRFRGEPNAAYDIEMTDDLRAGRWQVVERVRADAAGSLGHQETGGGTMRFYRALPR